MILAYEPSASMRAELADYDTLWQAQTIAYDGLVMLTGQTNPVDSLTLDQIRDIYAGKISNWKQVGGQDQPIRIYVQDENSGLQTPFERQVMAGTEIVNPTLEWVYERPGVVRQAAAAFVPEAEALGFSSWILATRVNPQPEIKIIRIEGQRLTQNDRKREIPAEAAGAAGKQHRFGSRHRRIDRLAVKRGRTAVAERSWLCSRWIKGDEIMNGLEKAAVCWFQDCFWQPVRPQNARESSDPEPRF